MRHRIRTTGLALLAAFALGAVAAQGAWASSFDYGAGTTKIVGSGGHQVFNAGTSEISCSEVTFESTEFATNEVTVTPVYPTGKCTDTTFGVPTHVTFPGHYILSPQGSVTLTANVHLTPTFLGSSICTISVLQGIYPITGYSNFGGKVEIISDTSEDILYEEQAGGSCGAGSGTKGTYTGRAVAEGINGIGERTEIRWTE